jgi:hypothetical protein
MSLEQEIGSLITAVNKLTNVLIDNPIRTTATETPVDILPPTITPPRKRRTKAEIAAAKAEEAAAKAETNVLDGIGAEEKPEIPAGKEVTIDQLRAAASSLAGLDKNEPSETLGMAKQIVKDMGIEKLSNTPPELRQELINKLNAAEKDWNATLATTDTVDLGI